MGKYLKWGWVYLFVLCFGTANALGQIPLITTDQKGKPTQVFVSDEEYSKNFIQMVSSVQDSVFSVLKNDETSRKWHLRTIVIGIGLDFKVGLGPIFSVEAYSRFRLLFTNDVDPLIP